MTQYLQEQEKMRKAKRYDKWQKQEINRAENAMEQSVMQIRCKRMPYCKKEKTKHCFFCTCNLTRPRQNQSQNNYTPRIPGIKFL